MRHDIPSFLTSYNRQVWDKEIDEIKSQLKAEASPGVPHAKISNRNDQLLSVMGDRFNEIVLNRIEKIISMSEDELVKMDRRVRIDNNLVDPVRVFIKNEPHKVEKIMEGRLRLIMSVSLTDKVIEMLISKHLCKLEIQNWRDIPSKPGIGFSDEDNRMVYEDIMSSGLEMCSSDVSGWDWGVKEWQILDEAESIIKLANNPSPVWKHLLRMKAHLEAESVYQFSDGVMVAPNFKGIQNSGKNRTSRSNSWMRVRVADLVGSRKTVASGDDCLESKVDDAVNKYQRYGIRLKGYDEIVDRFEFCSRIYSKDGSYAVNKEKMIMNLLHQSPKGFMEYRLSMLGFIDELESRDDFQSILELVQSAGYYEVEGPHYM